MSKASIVVGLGMGDEGKGSTVDLISSAQQADRVVRFNGGQQAVHNVVVGNMHHAFSSYGAGTMSGLATWVSGYCTVDPGSVLREQVVLISKGLLNENTYKIRVHEDTKITTPAHVKMNRLREMARGDNRHGSTGRGFGETIAWEYYGNEPLRAKHLKDPYLVLDFVEEYSKAMGIETEPFDLVDTIHNYIHAIEVVSDDQFMSEIETGHTVFEGAQGFMLDENYGFNPHTTWSTTTPAKAKELCREAGIENVTTYGCLRTYATRHGAGPFPGDECYDIPELHNKADAWAGSFRTGKWDMELLKWAVDITSPDMLSLSHLDRFNGFSTTEGIVDPSELGVVAIEARGPGREHRTINVKENSYA